MKQFFTQLQKELKSYFDTFGALVIIGIYCLLSSVSAIYFGDFFVKESDIMNAYFVMQPMILILIIPSITMRLWTDEAKSGTLELLLTQPVGYLTLVLAKFFAAYAFFLITIGFSFPFLAFSAKLSILDRGLVVFGYLGLCLCGALFCAAGCLVSAFNKSVMLSYIISIFVLCLITLLYFNPTGNPLFSGMNFKDNYNAFLSGVMTVQNVFYFIWGTVLLLWLAVVVIDYRRNMQQKRLFKVFNLLLMLLFIFGNAAIGLNFDNSYDITSDRRYTLTAKSEAFLKDFNKRIDVTLFEAGNQRQDSNSQYAIYADFVERLFKIIERKSQGGIKTKTVSVEPFSALERKIIHENTPYTEDKNGYKIFMTAEFSDNEGNTAKINSFNVLRQNLLEADIMRLIRNFGKPKKEIALIASDKDLENMQSFYSLLKEFYTVKRLDLSVGFILPSYAAVVVINPQTFSTEFLLAAEQYVLNGGSFVMFHEPELINTPLIDFLNPFGFKPVAREILYTDINTTTGAIEPEKESFMQDVGLVLFNNAGKLNINSGKNYNVTPILKINDTIFGAASEGKFVSNYLNLSVESLEIKPLSEHNGKFIFIYDSDILKDDLYNLDETEGTGFYETTSLADNPLFFLRLMDFATSSGMEQDLSYKHNIRKSLGIGRAVLNNAKERYQDKINELGSVIKQYNQQKNGFEEAAVVSGHLSVKDLGDYNDILRLLEEKQDELSQTMRLIFDDYKMIIVGFTIFLVVIFPVVLLLVLALIIWIYKKSRLIKIRRLMSDA
ncbi:MAG: Gldg family protein [Alphaproteobacteria bacterium]|nr:Gldg family protein [Alphaproteobacteria bacterium]